MSLSPNANSLDFQIFWIKFHVIIQYLKWLIFTSNTDNRTMHHIQWHRRQNLITVGMLAHFKLLLKVGKTENSHVKREFVVNFCFIQFGVCFECYNRIEYILELFAVTVRICTYFSRRTYSHMTWLAWIHTIDVISVYLCLRIIRICFINDNNNIDLKNMQDEFF